MQYKALVLSRDLSQIFLNIWTKEETFEKPGKQGSLRHILKRSINKYECLGSQFFRKTYGV